MDSYRAAEEMGIKLKKRWLSTLDGRTRHAHQLLDGQVQDNDKPFQSILGDIMFPGDPNAAPANVYNCRCTMIAEVDGVDRSDARRWARDPVTGESVGIEDMSYAQWAEWKKQTKQVTSSDDSGIIETVKQDKPKVAYRTFETSKKANDFFYYDGEERGLKAKKSSLHGKWLDNLSPDEREAISWYTAEGYKYINNYWRRRRGWESVPTDMVEDASRQIDSAISRFTLKESIKVQRGVEDFYGGSLVESTAWNDIQDIIGLTYHDLGYGSATTLTGNKVATAKPVLFEIDIPAGKGRGAYVNKLAGQYEDKEYEFLIARGSKFEITDVEINDEPIPPQTIIKMRMIVDE